LGWKLEGGTAVIPAGQGFALAFGGKFVRVWMFQSGDGVEAIIHRVGSRFFRLRSAV